MRFALCLRLRRAARELRTTRARSAQYFACALLRRELPCTTGWFNFACGCGANYPHQALKGKGGLLCSHLCGDSELGWTWWYLAVRSAVPTGFGLHFYLSLIYNIGLARRLFLWMVGV